MFYNNCLERLCSPWRWSFLVALPLLASCQVADVEPPVRTQPRMSRAQAGEVLKVVTFPITRVAMAAHFPGVVGDDDPPAFFALHSSEPGYYEYSRLGADLQLVMRVDYKRDPKSRPYLTHAMQQPVKRGNRSSSIVITPDQVDGVSFLKACPRSNDVIEKAFLVSGTKDHLLDLYKQYKAAESQPLTSAP
ncbi:MAG TPA: hypothetical protein VLE43_15650 [Candidatus Saccharimonadia bacterium]|nr:hypothetical protein [Candidatus Saccharimonadia bacterium]